jgi:cytochrome c-type biogenesis protein CcmF
MLATLGTAGVATAFLGAVLLAVRGASAARSGRTVDLTKETRLLLFGSVIALGAMQLALVFDDFSIAYVANNHSSTTPFPFDIATAWAALEGSILVWGVVLAAFSWMVLRSYRRTPDSLGAAALSVMGMVSIFFFGLMLTVSNPFEVCVQAVERGCAVSSPWPWATVDAPVEGPGPNPLLQNHILMAAHPPILYLGFVGLTVPFAYAMGALALGIPGPVWLRRSQRATLIAWSFLTLGIVLGALWAYEVLSWGGYWDWDPVENASFIPWLVATAFIHSALVQQRRGMLQAWNFILVISTFALTILGTFITRSGTINSVHSFTQSAIGPALLGFLVLVLVGSFTLFAQRSHLVASSPRIDNLVSREGAFLANNLLLTVYAFVVLIGTIYPILLEAFTGQLVGVRGPFFNRLAVPLTFALLLVMGFGPVTPWRSAPPGLIWRRTRTPAVIALALGLVTALIVTRVGWVVLAVVLGVFVISCIVGLLMEQAGSRARKTGTTNWESARVVVGGDGAFWAGQLSHIGIVLMALGIAFAANLADHMETVIEPGDTVEFAGYEITYLAPFQRSEPNRTVIGSRLRVDRDRSFLAVVEPTLNLYPAMAIPTPDVLHRPGGDLYVTLLDLTPGSATITFDTSPMIGLLWIGGFLTAAGGFWAVTARRRERAAVEDRQTADV